MSTILKPFKWFYHAFGVDAIHDTGRNAWLIIVARMCRMLAFGANSLVLGLFLAELKFPDYQLGLFLTLTLLGDVFLGGYLTLIADRFGRRKVLVGGSVMMVFSGLVFASVENFWILLFAAVVGVVSATGGDFGPFRSIEESILSHLTTPKTRADVLAWYVTTSSLGSAVGTEAAGRIVHYLESKKGWTLANAYHVLFLSYVAMGLVNAGLTLMLTADCELSKADEAYSQVPQNEDEDPAPASAPARDSQAELPATNESSDQKPAWYKRFWHSISQNLSAISPSTRAVMYKLWFLLAVDSLADGMVPYPLTNYFIDLKFHPSKATLGDATGGAYLLGTLSTIFAGPLARKIGLINTMVFTHLPSSLAVLIFAVPNNLALTVVLLFIRAGLNSLDQAPRTAFIAAVVKPQERTAVMGITAMIRTLASMSGPTVTGILANNDRFWIAFVAAGSFRVAYDIGLYAMFVNMKLYQNEDSDSHGAPATLPRASDEEMFELGELDSSDDDDDDHLKSKGATDTPETSDRSSQEAKAPPKTDRAV